MNRKFNIGYVELYDSDGKDVFINFVSPKKIGSISLLNWFNWDVNFDYGKNSIDYFEQTFAYKA